MEIRNPIFEQLAQSMHLDVLDTQAEVALRPDKTLCSVIISCRSTATRGLRIVPCFLPSQKPAGRHLVLCASRSRKKMLGFERRDKSRWSLLKERCADTRLNCRKLHICFRIFCHLRSKKKKTKGFAACPAHCNCLDLFEAFFKFRSLTADLSYGLVVPA